MSEEGGNVQPHVAKKQLYAQAKARATLPAAISKCLEGDVLQSEGMIKAVIFDLGGVIVPFDFKRAYTRMEGFCPYPAAEIPQRLRSTDLVMRFETGGIGPEDFVREISAILELRTSHDEFCDIFNCIFMNERLMPESLLERIRDRHRLLLLSNTNPIHFSMIDGSYPIMRHFHDRVLSYEVGAQKPSPRIYQEAIARAGCRTEECFFTDDVALFVEAARREGIDAVQFQSAAQIEEELRRRSVL
jgi:HAD superfamily hydrolase (TIGR01509 family)